MLGCEIKGKKVKVKVTLYQATKTQSWSRGTQGVLVSP